MFSISLKKLFVLFTKGCAQYDREEKGREPCVDDRGVAGFTYNCCEKDGGGDPGDPGGKLYFFPPNICHQFYFMAK